MSSNRRSHRPAAVFAIGVALAGLAGCKVTQRDPVPIVSIKVAEIPGMPGVRAFAGEFSDMFHRDMMASVESEREGMFRTADGHPSYSALAISGGGAGGAFGAGFLKGWSETGTRPIFKLVTGVSTGALIAPFAFLGSDHDDELEAAFTTIVNKDVYRTGNPFTIPSRGSFAKTDPLAELIARMVDGDILQGIANEHERGRRLYVGTVNLDAQRLVIWNMGKIAVSDHPGALDLFRSVLLASASIPVMFPPVYIEVEVDGVVYDEMHVDGGLLAQLFFTAAILDLRRAREEMGMRPGQGGGIYILRNAKVEPDPDPIDRPNLKNMVKRTTDTMNRAGGMWDLYRVYGFTRDAAVPFRFVDIPATYRKESKKMFDPDDMRRLFDLGYETALQDDPWRTTLPGYDL